VSDATRTEGEPHDRLTGLCDVMTKALRADPGCDDAVKCAVFLQDGDRGGLVLDGYENDVDAIADLFMHLKAIFEANGKKLMIAPLGGEG